MANNYTVRTVTDTVEIVSTEVSTGVHVTHHVPANSAGTAQTFGAGAVSAATPRVTHASDDPVTTAVQLMDDAIVADDAAFTPATTKVMMAGFEFDDTSPDSVDEGDAGAARMSANRNIYINVRDNAGNERGLNVDANGEVGIGAIRTSVTPGTAAANLGKAVDSAAGGTDTGVAALAVRDDALATLTPADGDYVPVRTDSLGALWVRQSDTVSTATVSSLASSASSAQLLAANTSRRGLMIHNTDANALYIKYGTTAAATDFSVKIPSDGYWEMPRPVYTGRIDAIWAADGSGSAYYTEL